MDKENTFVKALVKRGIPYVTACDIYLENLKPLVEFATKKAEVRALVSLRIHEEHTAGLRGHVFTDFINSHIDAIEGEEYHECCEATRKETKPKLQESEGEG